VDLAVVDVSFISLRLVLPAVAAAVRQGGDVVALVKPQFEAARTEVRKGLVADPAVHARVVDEVRAAAAAVGLTPLDAVPSPVTGAARGNTEFLLHLRRA
jgi:23S rRNA (cytidine1920-2'-O)/16S rRNA (cytidine1409-2'-O)-methyltransferase